MEKYEWYEHLRKKLLANGVNIRKNEVVLRIVLEEMLNPCFCKDCREEIHKDIVFGGYVKYQVCDNCGAEYCIGKVKGNEA